MALTEPCLACENWSLQWPKAEGDQNLGGVVFAARPRSWSKPSKNSPGEAEGIDPDIRGAGVWITAGTVSHHPRAGIAVHPRKCRGDLSPLCLERHRLAQLLENLQKLRCHHSGAGRCSHGAQGMCLPLPGEELCCPWEILNTQERFLLNKTSRFCEEELLPAVRIYRLRFCACTLGVQVPASTDMSELIFS